MREKICDANKHWSSQKHVPNILSNLKQAETLKPPFISVSICVQLHIYATN